MDGIGLTADTDFDWRVGCHNSQGLGAGLNAALSYTLEPRSYIVCGNKIDYSPGLGHSREFHATRARNGRKQTESKYDYDTFGHGSLLSCHYEVSSSQYPAPKI